MSTALYKDCLSNYIFDISPISFSFKELDMIASTLEGIIDTVVFRCVLSSLEVIFSIATVVSNRINVYPNTNKNLFSPYLSGTDWNGDGTPAESARTEVTLFIQIA